jgi:dTDP-glucose 4,6-dehydratase
LDYILGRTENLWRSLAGERLFVTGGTGFFGIWLLETLAHANDRLGLDIRASVLTRDRTAFAARMPHLTRRRELSWHEGDPRTFAFPPGEFSQVVHLATPASAALNANNSGEMFDIVVAGTRHTLAFAAQAGCANFLLTSSGAVYGPQPPELDKIPETYAGAPDPNDPRSAYAEGKRAAELLCALARCEYPGLQPKIARCFAFVGPHLPLDAHFAIGNFIRDALGEGDILVQGDGTPYRSYLHAADLIVWLMTVLLRGEANRPYNVGSDEAVSIAELARRVGARVAPGKRIVVREQASGAPPARYVPGIDRARRELKLSVGIGLDAAISCTAAWYRCRS